ncbi:hypothetical protein M011DRAFT_470252 [Sporormia fimetaria CBS 119925]|uniref:Exocyst complex component Sec3 PIP2-binding N-terminal domain-containing protein n=1 Tax=Sporormia fimetaria CBS 119925 TaxID=1340428 RepID=A0A6A6V4M3_9PLEO|nr:hypothetical protein M011DRAFT_470252 [Sporormia fimetaria CBS 119925]
MDASNRQRNPGGGMPPGGPRGSGPDNRRPPGALGSSSSSATGTSGMSRAERFDDERRRITESCFSKTDEKGQLVESYITHIRIQEDGAYPQAPPPPNSNPASKKARVIIVAVRSTGRVRIHKARENVNGTFSIGKTWNMEELSAIENFVHSRPKSDEEAQRKQWAGDVGFVVTVQKPYYWEAGTAKEKEFFIGSMVKIYHKYTQGDYPVLTGFSNAELEALTNGQPQLATAEARAARKNGAAEPPARPGPTNGMPMKSPGMPPSQSPGPGNERERRPPPLRDDRRPPPLAESRRPPPLSGERRPPPLPADRQPTPQGGERRPPPLDDRRPSPFSNDQRPFSPGIPPPRRPPTGDGDPRDRRPPPLRGPPPQGRPREEHFGPGDTQRRPRPSPSMEQGMRSSPSQEQMDARAMPNRERMDMRSPPSRERMGMRPSPSSDRLNMRQHPSREQMRPMPLSGAAPSPLPQRLTPQSSRSDPAVRPDTPESASAKTMPINANPDNRLQADDAQSQRSQRSRMSFETPAEELPMPGVFPADPPNPNGLRPGTSQSNASSALSRQESRQEEAQPEQFAPQEGLPERKRPPMSTSNSQHSQLSHKSSDLHTSAASPAPPSILQAGRRPPEAPGRHKATPSKNQAELAKHDLIPSPPPTSPLPEIPTAPEPEIAAAIEKAPEKHAAVTDARPSSPASVTSSVTSPIEGADEPQHRPGLGPMIKKKTKMDTANVLRKAAFAAGAFKPRAGGAAAKLFAKETKPSDEPDGISGVFVPQRAQPKEPEKKADEENGPEPVQPMTGAVNEVVPSVTISSPPESSPVTSSEVESKPVTSSPEKSVVKPEKEKEAEVRRKKRRSNQQMMNISKLGIDPNMLDDRGLEFESLLSEFGWWGSDLSQKNIDTFEHEIKLEISRVEAGSWLNHLEQKDDRVEAVEKMLDRAIAECDELEGLLTLYNVELSSLNDDIAFIEAQSQGLQVQTANQRLLQSELQQLVETISITDNQLEPLRRERIGKAGGLEAIESSLVLLYKALVTIDPAFVEGHRASSTGEIGKVTSNSVTGINELVSMQALQEKKQRYLQESAMFLDRLKQHMVITFGAAFMQTKDLLANLDKSGTPSMKANLDAHDAGRSTLWMFSPLVLFAKEIDRAYWAELLRMYQSQAGPVYQDEIRDNLMGWKRLARKPTGEEQELLFTAQEKESESITGVAARKLTVKRSQTLARGLRAASGDKESKASRAQSGKLHAFDVFAKALDDSSPLLLTEQNFITDFFHATSSEAMDFPDAVSAAPPESRRGKALWGRRPFEADRAMAKQVAEVMEDIFSFWPTEIQNLVDWSVTADPLQGVGILCAVDRKLVEIEDSNQDFLMKTLQKLHERLTGLFTRFVDDQIRAIEDTKVKIKKRKGVIRFIHTFPHFSMAIENMLPSPDESEQLEVRRMVDDAYQKINKAMFESLKVIAKESPAVMGAQGQGDPEDKEALNYHILLIENMNHYIEEVDDRGDPILREWKSKAEQEMREHMDLYVDAVIRRPLGKLLEFVESTEMLLAQPGATGQGIAGRSSHSKSVFKKLLQHHDGKELRKGIEALKKRVDKHFGDADDAGIARNLVAKVYAECEERYVDAYERVVSVGQDVYMGEVEVEWGVNEIRTGFRR